MPDVSIEGDLQWTRFSSANCDKTRKPAAAAATDGQKTRLRLDSNKVSNISHFKPANFRRSGIYLAEIVPPNGKGILSTQRTDSRLTDTNPGDLQTKNDFSNAFAQK